MADLRGREVVHRPALVVLAPAAPVLDRLEHGLELGHADPVPSRALRERAGVRGPHRTDPGIGTSSSPGSGRPAVIAPSTVMRWPDRYDASSEHIHTIGRAISSGSAKRPIGIRSRKTFDCVGWLMTNAESRVLMMPGAIALTRTPTRDSSSAAVCITATIPALDTL